LVLLAKALSRDRDEGVGPNEVVREQKKNVRRGRLLSVTQHLKSERGVVIRARENHEQVVALLNESENVLT
jgi:hypothetical protein